MERSEAKSPKAPIPRGSPALTQSVRKLKSANKAAGLRPAGCESGLLRSPLRRLDHVPHRVPPDHVGGQKAPQTVDCGDKRMDHVSRDIPEDREVWMSYTEAARALGIDVGSVKKRARRRGWRRQPGNDGTTRIAVPRDALGGVPRDVSKDGRGDTSTPKMALSPGTSPETDAAIQALQGQIAAVENHNATLREQLAKAED